MKSKHEALAVFLDEPDQWTPRSLRLLQETVSTFPRDAKEIMSTLGACPAEADPAAKRVAEIVRELAGLVDEAIGILVSVE